MEWAVGVDTEGPTAGIGGRAGYHNHNDEPDELLQENPQVLKHLESNHNWGLGGAMQLRVEATG